MENKDKLYSVSVYISDPLQEMVFFGEGGDIYFAGIFDREHVRKALCEMVYAAERKCAFYFRENPRDELWDKIEKSFTEEFVDKVISGEVKAFFGELQRYNFFLHEVALNIIANSHMLRITEFLDDDALDLRSKLWDMVNNAKTHEDVEEVKRVIEGAEIDNDMYDDLMEALSYISRELYREKR